MNLELFENNWAKLASIVYSLTITIFMTPVFLSIVSYENNHQYRTLINQLVTKLILSTLIGNAVVQIPSTILYIHGPLPWYICYPQVFLFPTLSVSFTLLLDSVSIVRYLFIFWLKNPTGLQDDFWAEFFFMWTYACSFISNLVYFIMPGRGPNMLYVCLGSAPSKQMNGPPSKTNYFVMGVFIFSTIIQILAIGKHQIHQACGTLMVKNNLKREIYRPKIANFTFTFIVIAIVFSFSFMSFAINTFSLDDLLRYPNYLLLYAFHLVSIPTANIFFAFVMFQKDRNLLKYLIKDVKERITSLRKNLDSFKSQIFTVFY